jgi:hypothetical protein
VSGERDGVVGEWSTTAWLDEAQGWVAGVLSGLGVTEVGTLEPHSSQPWSAVWRVDCGESRYWFKANARARWEGAVLTAAAGMAPEYVDAPVAEEQSHGRILTRDAGPLLRTALENVATVEVGALAPVVADFARLQRRTLGRRDLFASRGVLQAPAVMPDVAAAAQASYLAGLPAIDPRRIDVDQYDRVMTALPALREAGRTLAEGPVPMALDQGDLWPGNISCPVDGGGFRFFDFADASWGHPFGSLAMMVVECLYRWEVPQPVSAVDLREERTRAVIDAYLREWTDFAPLEQLRELAGYALRVAPLNRTAAWIRNLEGADPDALDKYGRMPWAWLEDVTKLVLV